MTPPSDCSAGSSSQPDPTHDVQADNPIPVIQDVGSYLALLYAEIAAFHPLHCLEIARDFKAVERLVSVALIRPLHNVTEAVITRCVVL